MRKTSQQLYDYWLQNDTLDKEVKEELLSIKDSSNEIEERFYRDLEFGTGGMRGVIGAGTNRMNIYTVRRATQGLAEYVLENGGADSGVVIGYDTRYLSDVFAKETARVLVANGIKAYLFDAIHATPEVSFAIRYYNAAAGVMVTASHNPKEYNGYKAYGPDGAQFPPEASDAIVEVVNKCDIFEDVKIITDSELETSDLFELIGKEVDEKFIDTVCEQAVNPGILKEVGEDFKIVYTPLHGTGLRPVMAVLERIGMKNVIVEPNQAVPDSNFSTVKSPNPEEKDAFTDAIELAKKNNASIIIGTDPDADRVGVVVRDREGEYRVLTGNQTGALLCEYILSAKKAKNVLLPTSTIIKTIVTSDIGKLIAKNYGVQIVEVLTGFKYIAEKIAEYEKTGSNVYEFGFEESYGYLPGTYARDKDSVASVMLIVEMAATYRAKNMTLYDGLIELFERYGYHEEKTVSVVMPGKDGMKQISDTMKRIRENLPTELGGIKIKQTQDYLSGVCYNDDGTKGSVGDFPKSNVLKFCLADDKTFVVVRPSGTEPKIKLYICTAASTAGEAHSQINYMTGAVRGYLGI